jgi:hypothetical protein
LRTYRTFKAEYGTEIYLSAIRFKSHRSAYAKFRCGVAPLRIETGRYERVLLHQRTCFNCTDTVESEEHVLLSCPLYNDLRESLFETICDKETTFIGMCNVVKLSVILASDNVDIVRASAKICNGMLNRRRTFVYR